jgi:hypothetical protein
MTGDAVNDLRVHCILRADWTHYIATEDASTMMRCVQNGGIDEHQ